MRKRFALLLLTCSICQFAFADNPETGWWWNSAESGRGFSIEKQGSTIFFAAYLYDDSSNPIWYTAVLTGNGTQGFTGTLQEYGGGQTLLGQYQAPAIVNDNLGTIRLDFSTSKQGTLTWPGGVVPITRFVFSTDQSSADNSGDNNQSGNGTVDNTGNSNQDGNPGNSTAQTIALGRDAYQLTCSNSTCHGTDPAANQNSILVGRDPVGIQDAFKFVRRMVNAGIPDQVTADEVNEISAYLRSLK